MPRRNPKAPRMSSAEMRTVALACKAIPRQSSAGGGQQSGVQSVAGKTGNVTLNKSDVALGNVDNTSDANKPVSTATQAALDGKAASGHNHDASYEAIGAVATHAAAADPHTGYQKESEKGQPNGYASLDAGGKVPSAQLPPGSGAAWGGITGTLSDQADLQAALDAKSAASHNHTDVYEPANANIQAHVAQAHAPANAQKNSDITKAEIEAKLTGEITSHTHPGGGGGGPTIKSGVVNLTAGGTALVTFTTPFGIGVTPHVVVCSQFNGTDTSTTLFAHTVTNLGFTIKGAGNAAGNVAWIATDAGNA